MTPAQLHAYREGMEKGLVIGRRQGRKDVLREIRELLEVPEIPGDVE